METRSSISAKSLATWVPAFERYLALLLIAGAIVAAVATLLAINGIGPFPSTRSAVRPLLFVDAIIFLALGLLVVRRLIELWLKRRRGSAGSRLHVRLVALLSFTTLGPTLVIAITSALFLHSGVQVWFSESTKAAINQSVVVADAYIKENRKTIEADARAVATQLQSRVFLMRTGQERSFERALTFFSEARGLSEAVVFDSNQIVLSASPLSGTLTGEGPVAPDVLNRARAGEVVLARGADEARVRAVMRLDTVTDTYLMVGRLVDPKVLAYADRVKTARADYERLETERPRLEIGLAMVLMLMALLLLVVAILVGLLFSNRLVRPISELVSATERVRAGDLSRRVAEREEDDEFGILSRAFNLMTSQLQTQREELVDANRQLDARRRFTETVLAGVSSGVLGLDRHGCITLPNKAAGFLLSLNQDELIGEPLSRVVPEMQELFHRVVELDDQLVEEEITVRRGNITRRFLVRIGSERLEAGADGYVVTFDDISELVSAQRRAAWADIARRIAHEIKNPLTPIKLSAERLRKKYSNQVKVERETFEQCTDTIVRQVDEIGRMVSEFSNFARMPSPEFRSEDLVPIVRESCFLQTQAHPGIKFTETMPGTAILINCDRQQVTRALTNILQNSAEAIVGNCSNRTSGTIEIKLSKSGNVVTIDVEDNGPGLPSGAPSRLTEPYVTTRTKGTGLGLAIAKKIMEEHRGRLLLENREAVGARVTLIFFCEPDVSVHDDMMLNTAAE